MVTPILGASPASYILTCACLGVYIANVGLVIKERRSSMWAANALKLTDAPALSGSGPNVEEHDLAGAPRNI